MTSAIQGDVADLLVAAAAEEGAKQERGAVSVQLGHKAIVGIVVGWVISVYSGGEIGRAGVPRHHGVPCAVHGDAGGLVVEVAAEVGDVGQGASGGNQLGHESVIATIVERRIQRADGGGQVGGGGQAGHIDGPFGIQGQIEAPILGAAAEKGAEEQLISAGAGRDGSRGRGERQGRQRDIAQQGGENNLALGGAAHLGPFHLEADAREVGIGPSQQAPGEAPVPHAELQLDAGIEPAHAQP